MHYVGRMAAIVIMGFAWIAGSAQQPPAEKPTPSAEKKPVMQTPSMRLAAARNIFIIRTHGSAIPFDVIKSTLDGWGRFSLVETKDKADLIIEVASSGDSGVQVSSSSSVSADSGQEEKSTSTRKDLSSTEITMMVFDARNKRPLWSATESVKFAMKEKSKENNLVEAAERLAAKFHDRLEPAAAK
ncbi:MAG TPA: hypothetical protein VJW20_08875 [Candidatus Angelobacter sp.]|nr:hypothetical protein [Candidatus Angelobacter sp.]